MAAGLLLVSVADRLARSGNDVAQPLFWAGLTVIVLPALVRQLSPESDRNERIGLVLVLGMLLYLVKVAANPYAFTFPDEFTHMYNVDQILQTQHLLSPNPMVDITPSYPGLANVTAALTSLGTLSPFQAGIVVVGAARLLLMAALFLLLEQITGSARVSGIAASV